MTADSNGRPNTLTVIHQFRGIENDKINKETFHFALNKDHYKDARNNHVVESSRRFRKLIQVITWCFRKLVKF
jgi:hypothetical protein